MDGPERMLKTTAEREGLDYFEMLSKQWSSGPGAIRLVYLQALGGRVRQSGGPNGPDGNGPDGHDPSWKVISI